MGFGGFIAACGLTHLCDVTVFWWPAYRFYTLVDAITAVLSIGTAMVLPSAVQFLRRLPTSDGFRRINEELERTCRLKEQAITGLEETVRALRRQVGHLEEMRRVGVWAEEQEAALRELNAVLNSSSCRERRS
jgi:alcohol dehydrogenase class IV